MDHVILVKEKCDFVKKILLGEKTGEILCYSEKKPFFKFVKPNQNIFFKTTEGPIKLEAKIKNAEIFFGLDQEKAKKIFNKYREPCCFCDDIAVELVHELSKARYGFFVSFEQPSVIKPFEIGQEIKDYWLSVDSIEAIKTT